MQKLNANLRFHFIDIADLRTLEFLSPEIEVSSGCLSGIFNADLKSSFLIF